MGGAGRRRLLATMDELGIAAVVNLDGMPGDELEANLDRYDRAHPGGFATFAQLDRSRFAEADWAALGAEWPTPPRAARRG